ncbi:MAG: nucleotide exchange factor GrpE [Nanoarchaeota archaeon]|nr:nucleotide exchange factor GrpE [Nanoarchaeota archaeon]
MTKEEIEKAMKKAHTNEEQKMKAKEDPREAKIKELINDLQRLQAEFENYKKRVDRDNESFKEFAEADLIKKMLPVLDTLELSLQNTKDHEEFVKAVELVYSQLFQTLEDRGLKKIETQDKKFDPYIHEALLSEQSKKDEGTMLEEFQKGYMLKDRVLRHSKVKVAKAKK